MLLVLNSFMLRHRSFGTKFYFSMSKSTIFSTYEERNVMKIIFIRHGEPNYEIDSLTEKGWREAELLSKRTENGMSPIFTVLRLAVRKIRLLLR